MNGDLLVIRGFKGVYVVDLAHIIRFRFKTFQGNLFWYISPVQVCRNPISFYRGVVIPPRELHPVSSSHSTRPFASVCLAIGLQDSVFTKSDGLPKFRDMISMCMIQEHFEYQVSEYISVYSFPYSPPFPPPLWSSRWSAWSSPARRTLKMAHLPSRWGAISRYNDFCNFFP